MRHARGCPDAASISRALALSAIGYEPKTRIPGELMTVIALLST